VNDTRLEKLLLIALAFVSLIILGVLGVMALMHGTIDAVAAGIIGVIVTGLIAFSKDIVQAIRSYSMSAQLGKVTDQLAASAPTTPETAPQTAIDAADRVATAATDAADQIADDGKPGEQ
jgi:hypothetical protein